VTKKHEVAKSGSLLSRQKRNLKLVFSKDSTWSIYLIVILLGYLFLTLLSINGSSINELVDGKTGVLIGQDRPIRSDEFLRSTPFDLNRIVSTRSSGVSTLSAPSFDGPGIDSYDSLHPERIVLSILFSGSQLFAAHWWLPALILLIGLPLFLRKLNLQTSTSIAIGIVVLFSPSVVWWSNAIAEIVGRVALGCGLLLLGLGKTKLKSTLYGFFGCICITGAITDYQPWVIVVFLFFGVVMASIFLRQIKKIAFIGAGILLGMVPVVLFLIDKWPIIQIMKNTIYPGARRFQSGSVTAFNWAFSAPNDWSLLHPSSMIASNQSEFSLGYLFFIVPALYYGFTNRTRHSRDFTVIAATTIYLILLAWSFAPIPDIPFNPLKVIGPERCLTITTTLAPILFGVFLARRNISLPSLKLKEKIVDSQADVGRSAPLLLGVIAAFLTLIGSLSVKESVTPFPIFLVMIVCLIVGAVVWLIVKDGKHLAKGLNAFAFIAFIICVPVNPVVGSIQNFYQMDVTRTIENVKSDKAWASDSFFLDAILSATGKNQISGQQNSGPDIHAWRIIDPAGKYQSLWNAGSSYVEVKFANDQSSPVVTKPGPDQISVTLNPCSTEAKTLNLGFVASRSALSNSCLTTISNPPLQYLGNPVWLYRVRS
jgi:hypothetical protein